MAMYDLWHFPLVPRLSNDKPIFMWTHLHFWSME